MCHASCNPHCFELLDLMRADKSSFFNLCRTGRPSYSCCCHCSVFTHSHHWAKFSYDNYELYFSDGMCFLKL